MATRTSPRIGLGQSNKTRRTCHTTRSHRCYSTKEYRLIDRSKFETDFVARNEKFQQFVEVASRACLNYVSALPESELVSRTEFQEESLKNLVADNDSKKLADEMAMMIGLVGENASLRRAVCFKVPQSMQLIGTAYPLKKAATCDDGEFQFGNMGTILSVRTPAEITEELKKNLCLQVIGSNPLKVGNKVHDKPAANVDDEICLIHQEYLFDTSLLVGEVLEQHQIEVIDFQKYKCGEAESNEENVSAASN